MEGGGIIGGRGHYRREEALQEGGGIIGGRTHKGREGHYTRGIRVPFIADFFFHEPVPKYSEIAFFCLFKTDLK